MLWMTVEGQRKIEQRVLQVFPTWVLWIVVVKLIIEEEAGIRGVVLDTNLEDSDQGTDPAVVTVRDTTVLGLVQDPPWHFMHSVEEDIQDLV